MVEQKQIYSLEEETWDSIITGCQFIRKLIAKFLKLNDPDSYTGHCFRRSSTILLADAGGHFLDLKSHSCRRFSSIAESYVENSVTQKMVTNRKILTNSDNYNVTSAQMSSNKNNLSEASSSGVMMGRSRDFQLSNGALFQNLNNCTYFQFTY